MSLRIGSRILATIGDPDLLRGELFDGLNDILNVSIDGPLNEPEQVKRFALAVSDLWWTAAQLYDELVRAAAREEATP
ncbi:MAG: hypothetical protein AB7T37_07750 [Dehalococcoidia bacterium]